MPSEKSERVQDRRRRTNRVVRSSARTYVKSAERLIQKGGSEDAATAVDRAVSALDRAAAKGVVHRNNAARRKSRLVRKLQTAQAQEP